MHVEPRSAIGRVLEFPRVLVERQRTGWKRAEALRDPGGLASDVVLLFPPEDPPPPAMAQPRAA